MLHHSCKTPLTFYKKQTFILTTTVYTIAVRCMLYVGTKLLSHERQVYQRMMYKFNLYIKTDTFSTEKYFSFCEDILRMDPRLGQHFIEVAFYKNRVSVMDFKKYLPEIEVEVQPNSLFIDNSVVVAGIHARLLKQHPFFKDGRLMVLEAPQTLTNIDTTKALDETGQSCPDYLFYINGISRYFDLKSGNMQINKGHVFSTSDKSYFEKMASYLLQEQLKLYKKHIEVAMFLSNVIKNDTLSWVERNEHVHAFYLTVLPKYPDITPSLVFNHKVSYETKNLIIPKCYETLVSSDVVSSKEASERALIALVSKGTHLSIERYLKDPRNNQNIVKALKQIFDEGFKNND